MVASPPIIYHRLPTYTIPFFFPGGLDAAHGNDLSLKLYLRLLLGGPLQHTKVTVAELTTTHAMVYGTYCQGVLFKSL